MILIVDTTQAHLGNQIVKNIKSKTLPRYELLDATKTDISPCIGCNYCWLKTPGICTIKDDYATILKKLLQADQLWLVADTQFGFISYKGKNIADRLLPLLTMGLCIKKGEMRHIPRYDNLPDFGIIYSGNGDKAYLERWTKRMALNLGVNSLGAYSADEIQEAGACIL